MRTLLIIIALLTSLPARAWGPLGHRMVAETAAILLSDEPGIAEWSALFARHRFELGYFSIIPDSDFRHSDGNQGKTEGPTHFFDLDLALGADAVTRANRAELETKLAQLPRDWPGAKAWLEKNLGPDKAAATGSAPWRVEQLSRLAQTELASVSRPEGGYLRGTAAQGEIKRVYRGMLQLGILSHYTGDVAMPYHAVSDWNGYRTGHGGIHFYFESDCVNALEPGLSNDVLRLALARRKEWVTRWTRSSASIPEAMLQVLFDSFAVIPELEALDRRTFLPSKKGSQPSKDVERHPATAKHCKVFRDLLVDRLARGSVLTAWVWAKSLPRDKNLTGLSKLQFSDFDWKPDFIPPNY